MARFARIEFADSRESPDSRESFQGSRTEPLFCESRFGGAKHCRRFARIAARHENRFFFSANRLARIDSRAESPRFALRIAGPSKLPHTLGCSFSPLYFVHPHLPLSPRRESKSHAWPETGEKYGPTIDPLRRGKGSRLVGGTRYVVFPRPKRPQFEKTTSRDPLSSQDPLPQCPLLKEVKGGGFPAGRGRLVVFFGLCGSR